MPATQKILLLDDEQELLDVYQGLLKSLPQQPDVRACDSGARAIAMLESEPFNLLISDLNMPRMDGLQVLSIVRRRFPQIRIVVMTSVMDEQYRNRAYSLGVDLFWQKPGNEQEIKLFMECIQSLLEREEQGGFRGVQSKSLVDLIQLECMSQNSTVLKITNGQSEGRIWILNGEIIDSVVGDMTGEEAFKRIISWKGGNFEGLPAETARTRTIFNSYQGLLLDAAQSIDESQASNPAEMPVAAEGEEGRARVTPAQAIGRIQGVEFVLDLPVDAQKPPETWGVDNPEPLSKWMRATVESFRQMGEQFVAGQVQEVEGRGLHRHAVVSVGRDKLLCVGLQRSLSPEQIRETMKNVLAQWAS
jgi:CheY-like chemotaxis protein